MIFLVPFRYFLVISGLKRLLALGLNMLQPFKVSLFQAGAGQQRREALQLGTDGVEFLKFDLVDIDDARASRTGSSVWAQCLRPRLVENTVTFGATYTEVADFEHTRCMLVWGTNPPSTWPKYAAQIMDARERGAALIFGSNALISYSNANRVKECLSNDLTN